MNGCRDNRGNRRNRIFSHLWRSTFVLVFLSTCWSFNSYAEDPKYDKALKDQALDDEGIPLNLKERMRRGNDPKSLKERNAKAQKAGIKLNDRLPLKVDGAIRNRAGMSSSVAPSQNNLGSDAAATRKTNMAKTENDEADQVDDTEEDATPDNPPPASAGGSSLGLPPRGPSAPPVPPAVKQPIPTSEDAEKKMNERKAFTEFEKGELYHIDYYDQDLLEFIKQMAEKFKINFLIGDKVKGGKITLISPNPVTREQAWQAFLSVLRSRDLALVRVGKFYKVIPVRDAQRSPIKTYLEGGDTEPSEEVITYMLKLSHVEIKDVDKILKDFKTKEGEVLTYEPTNSVIITDTAINIRRMVKILKELDVPSGRDSIHVIDIYYASAQEVADTLNQIFGEKAKGKSSTKKKTTKKTRRKSKKKTQTTEPEDDQVTITNIIAEERTNQLIVVAPRAAMPRILDMINRLDVPIPGDGQVHVYYLENANAEELSSTLSSLSQGSRSRSKKGKSKTGDTADLFEGEVKITADKSTNSLVIVASTKDFNALTKVIDKLDIRRRQVFVEAVIMEVRLSVDRSLGVAMNGGFTMTIDGETVPVYAGTTLGTMSSISIDPTTLSGMAVGVQGPDLAGTEGLVGDAAIPSFGVLMQALQTDSNANVLSTPHILTTDNEEAEIIVGSNVPFITGSSRDSNNQPVLSIQRQDVALTMKIKPQINESDFVRLQVQQEVTELVSISETLGPTTTKRAAKSSVVVKDNQTIVIGGMLRDRNTEDIDKVPFLGDLPILGRLFRRDRDAKEKTNLLIFLTPHIIKDEEDFKRIYRRKMEERAEFLKRFYGEDEDLIDSTDYSQKTGIVEHIRQTISDEEAKAQAEEKERQEKETLITPEDERGIYEIGVGTDQSLPLSLGEDEADSSENVSPPSEVKSGYRSKKDLMRHVFEQPSSDSDEEE